MHQVGTSSLLTAGDTDIWNYWKGQRPMRAVAPLKKNGSHVSGSKGGSHRKPWLHHQFVATKFFFCGTRNKASTIWWRNTLYNSRHHCCTEFNKQVVESLWEHLAATVGFCACVTNVPIGVPGFLCRIFPCSNLNIWRPPPPLTLSLSLLVQAVSEWEATLTNRLHRTGPLTTPCRFCSTLHTLPYSKTHFYWQQRPCFSIFQRHAYKRKY